MTLSFPDPPKLELDELIDDLVDRAKGVKRVQGRLRALLRAIDLINTDLSLEAVLRHIVEAARTLAGAQYGALGVLDDHGRLEQFVHVGIDDEQARLIGTLPVGIGLLGALTTDPRPIRLPRLGEDPRSSGFPAHHPPMDSFLGVPIRVRDRVYGNLYLTESEHGQFSAEDEELVRSLALAAGSAISNARLYDDSRRQQRWLAASVEISSGMLSEAGEDPLLTVARTARDLTSADLVTIALVTEDGHDLLVEVAVCDSDELLAGRRFPRAASLAGTALATGTPLMLPNAATSGDTTTHMTGAVDVGPLMVVPLGGSSGVLGVLSLARRQGLAAFTGSDLDLAVGFAGHASVALEFAKARADQHRMTLFEERDRIARDLHDHVIQQLFAIGLSLQGLAEVIGPEHDAAAKLRARVEDVNRTMRQIRASIFELRDPRIGAGHGVRADVLSIAVELGPALGFAPHVSFSGPVDSVVVDALVDDLRACVREALTNVAKHADATRVDVRVHVDGDVLRLSVVDDGIGIPAEIRPSGLDNLRIRAEVRGGSLRVGADPEKGSELIWTTPIR